MKKRYIQFGMLYTVITCAIVLLLLWIYSRYMITYTHEFSSWTYYVLPYEDGTSIEFSTKDNTPIFLRIVIEDVPIKLDVVSHVLINEYDLFSAIFNCYDKDYYYYYFRPEPGLPLKVEFDRKNKRTVFTHGNYQFYIINNGSELVYDNTHLVIDKGMLMTVILNNDGSVRVTSAPAIEVSSDVVVQPCPCPSSDREAEKVVSDGQTGEN